MKKVLILLSLAVVVFSPVVSDAHPAAPSKGQWAFALEGSLPLYQAPDSKSDSAYVEVPEQWLKVPSAVKDNEDNMWYKVQIGKETGWLAQNGVLLKMGPKSKAASDLYDAYAKKMRKAKKNPGLFTTEDPAECKEFLGFNPLGMNETSIQKRLGKPTARYTDYIESQFTTFSYELPTKNMTFDVFLQNGKVYAIELRNGSAEEIKLN
ncbi:MAG: hypothetical protein IJU31_03300 [Synergistaceae bacterium]|nr:hypothetical protein [Synergistaceae bacterium]